MLICINQSGEFAISKCKQFNRVCYDLNYHTDNPIKCWIGSINYSVNSDGVIVKCKKDIYVVRLNESDSQNVSYLTRDKINILMNDPLAYIDKFSRAFWTNYKDTEYIQKIIDDDCDNIFNVVFKMNEHDLGIINVPDCSRKTDHLLLESMSDITITDFQKRIIIFIGTMLSSSSNKIEDIISIITIIYNINVTFNTTDRHGRRNAIDTSLFEITRLIHDINMIAQHKLQNLLHDLVIFYRSRCTESFFMNNSIIPSYDEYMKINNDMNIIYITAIKMLNVNSPEDLITILSEFVNLLCIHHKITNEYKRLFNESELFDDFDKKKITIIIILSKDLNNFTGLFNKPNLTLEDKQMMKMIIDSSDITSNIRKIVENLESRLFTIMNNNDPYQKHFQSFVYAPYCGKND